MKAILAEHAGFCFGVERAVNKVYEQIDNNVSGRKIFTFGPIIHNDEVVKDMESKGVYIVDDVSRFPDIKGSVLIIRSHGAAEYVYKEAEKNGIEIVDATCPFVKKIHNTVREAAASGHEIIIVGDRNHPEVQGIIGWAGDRVYTIGSIEEAESFKADKNARFCLVSQTTFNLDKFQYIVEIIQKKGYYTDVVNTICNATATRQKEAGVIAAQADKMIVIGDPRSSNTQKLYEICKEYCEDTYYIQTLKDLASADLQTGICVGITAGASTPNYLIQEVLLYVRGIQ